MSTVVNFDVEGFKSKKPIHVIDTMANVHKAAEGLEKALDLLNNIDPESTFFQVQDQLRKLTLENVADLLGFNKTETKELENASYSGCEDFYEEVCEKFVGLDYPTVKQLTEDFKNGVANETADDSDESEEPAEDPKSKEED